LAKRLLSKESEPHTFSEIVNVLLGRMHRVVRREHKGYDYLTIFKEVQKYFEIVDVRTLPFKFLQRSFSFQIGILTCESQILVVVQILDFYGIVIFSEIPRSSWQAGRTYPRCAVLFWLKRNID
jgi:hypothetical protein